MAKVFSSGLEIGAPEVYYQNSGWTSTQTGSSTVDFSFDEAHVPGTGYGGGARCFKAASAGYGAAKFSPPTLATATSDGWVAFSWKASGASTIDRDVWVRITNATSHTDTIDGLVLKGKPTGTTYTLTITAGGKPLGSTTNVANDGGWHHIGIHYKAHATAGVVAIYYDGSVIFNYAGDTRGLGDTTTWDKVTWVHGVENDMGDGSDGSITVSSPAVLNKYTHLTETTTAATVKEVLVWDSTNFAVGDEIMLHQTQHATAAGTYEFNRINTIQTKRSLPGSTAWFNQEGVVAHYHFDEAPTPFPDNGATDGYVDMTGNEGLWHLNGGVTDSSGNSRNGAVVGATQITGRVGANAYDVSGVGVYLTFGGTNDFNFTTEDFSYSFWAKPSSSQVQYASMWGCRDNPNGGYFCRQYATNTNQYRVYESGTGTWSSVFTLTGDVWHHLAFVRTGTTLAIYVNGVAAASSTGLGLTFQASALPLTFGAQPFTPANSIEYWNGAIDEIAVWSRALSAAEVTAIYDNQKNPAQVTDYSGKGNHLTAYGNGDAGDYNYFSGAGKWTGSTTYRRDLRGGGGNWFLKTAGMIDIPLGNLPRTVMCWVKFHAVSGAWHHVWSLGNYAGGNQYNWGMFLSLMPSNKLQFGFIGNDPYINFTPVAGDWYHIVFLYDGSTPKAYVNGLSYGFVGGTATAIGTLPGVVAVGTHVWDVNGGNGSNTTDSAHVSVDEFVILDYALTADEIAGIYAVQNAATTAADAYLPVVVYDSDWVSTANMELYYKLDEAASATGADSIIDYSGNGYNGTPTSMTMGAAGQVGTCGTFGGGTIDAGYNSQLDFERTDPWTIGFWFKTSTAGPTGTHRTMLANTTAAAVGIFFNLTDDGRIRPHLYAASAVSGIHVSTPTGQTDGTWRHFVATYDGSSTAAGIKLYVNGAFGANELAAQGGTQAQTIRSGTSWLLGNSLHSPTSPYIGEMDEAFIFSRVLTAAEIQTIYRVQSDNYHTIGLTKGLKTPFYSGTFDTAAPNGVVSQMVSVPNYTSIGINTGIAVTPDAWDGYKGGIVALKATGTATIAGTISADGAGYRGGVGTEGTGASQNRGYQGESIRGKGAISPTANDGGGSGTISDQYQEASGGGGAGYATAGGVGVKDPDGSNPGPDVPGGSIVGSADLAKLHLGSGGGGGGKYTGNGVLTTGGVGGGAVYLAAETITVTGNVKADGASGGASTHENSSNAGSGAGGSVYLAANTIGAGTSKVTTAGGAAVTGVANSGAGGVGSAGRIRTNYATTTGTTTPTAYADAVPATMSDQFDHLVIFDAPSDPGNSKMFIQGVRPNATYDAGAFVVDGNHLSADWFDMTGCAALYHLDETSGTTATDSSGNGNTATLTGGTTVGVTGKVGPSPKGYDFNGTSGYVSVDLAGDAPTTAGTVLGWVKLGSTSSANGFLFGMVDLAGTQGEWRGLKRNVSAGYIGFVGWNGPDVPDIVALATGTWHHLALTWASTSNIVVYLDGAQVHSSTQGNLITPGTVFKVGGQTASPFYTDMTADECAVFNRTLSAAEVKSIYDYQAPAPLAFPDNKTADGYVNMAANKLLWHFDGNANDSSGNSLTGTLTNAPSVVTGRVGTNAYDFNGTNQYIKVDMGGQSPTTDGTICCWFKPDASSLYDTIFALGPASGGTLGNWRNLAQNAAGQLAFDGYQVGVTDIAALTTGAWHHAVLTWANTDDIKIYLNSALVHSSTQASLSTPGTTLWVGLRPDSYSVGYFDGQIDEVAVWSRTLTAAEVTAIYNNQLPVGNPRLHQAIDDTGDLTTSSKIIAPSATSCKFGMEGATDINAAWAPGTIIAVDAVAAIRGDGSITAAKVDIGGVGGGETEGISTTISPSPKIVTATAVVDPDGAGAITTAILGGLTTKVTVS